MTELPPLFRFYAEFTDGQSDLDVTPILAATYEAAVAKARAMTDCHNLKFLRVNPHWDAITVDGRTIAREDLQRVGDVNMLMSDPRRAGRQAAVVVDGIFGRAAE